MSRTKYKVHQNELERTLLFQQYILGLRIGPPPPNGAGGQHPGRMVVRLWEEVKIMKAEEHVRGFNNELVMNDMKTSAVEVDGGHTVELVACAEIDETVTRHLYAVAFAVVLMA